ncbi:crossover junction endodeoxyribonuclease RuvC [Pacificimonas flava]|uniref:Crossover junction endodeoxyribonuclease RuvC n=2 Tax=Pacificimonas TaxID=1960290 RepID=A0A219B1W7_9SPHN|nr:MULTISPECIES: crossover junction endodeoxyribonuclease RuvC [Pacificimonas]MBZ6378024.1 crossover junction endodeoxyribonuclease RuvC [Pacificimonas aurantium]OWV32331.1 crossover junction endodeoxyribonuclease RuvC [Pacificimonas flava]
MIIAGLDPSLTATGWGVIRAEGSRLSFVAAGTIKPPSALPMPARLAILFRQASEMLAAYMPQTGAMEEVFANQNPQSTLKLGQARGAVLAAMGAANLPCAEYAPRFVKKALVGTGGADKRQVRAMVERLLPGAQIDSYDASDALAVAITHAGLAGQEKRVMHA